MELHEDHQWGNKKEFNIYNCNLKTLWLFPKLNRKLISFAYATFFFYEETKRAYALGDPPGRRSICGLGGLVAAGYMV